VAGDRCQRCRSRRVGATEKVRVPGLPPYVTQSDLARITILRSEVARAINQEMPLVVRTITEALTGQGEGSPEEKEKEAVAALKCLEAWIDWGLNAEYVFCTAFHLKVQD
jgi:hypothetical protein